MTIRQLQYFLSICRTQNMTRSAEELFVSQPTLSVAMKELEKETGSALFYKRGNRISLTEAGIRFAKEAQALISQYEHVEKVIQSGELQRDHLRIGFSSVVGNTAAPRLCRKFADDWPQIKLHTLEGYGGELLAMLERDQLDAVITGSQYGESPEWQGKFRSLELNSSNQVFCVGTDSPAANKENLTLQEIAEIPLAMLSEDFPIAKRLEQFFSERGLKLNIILRTGQMFTVERFVAEGVAGGFLPEESVHKNRAVKMLQCPEFKAFSSKPVSLYWKALDPLPEPLKRFIQSSEKAAAASK